MSPATTPPGAITAGGPTISASTYVPANATPSAARSAAMSVRTRPRTRRRGPRLVLASGGSTTRREPRPRAGVSRTAPLGSPSGRDLLMRDHEVVDVGVATRLGPVRDPELAVGVGEVELH